MEASQEIIIEPGARSREYWRELWRFRELFFLLAWRDILVRYKQTVVGVSWSVLRPLLSMAIFTFVFGRIARLPSDGMPYPILVFAALLPWQFFSNALTDSGNSLVNNANLISKVYFPRMVVPASGVLVALCDFFISLALLGLLMVFYGVAPNWRILTVPILLVPLCAAALGVALLTSALTVKYRDLRIVIPFAVQFGFFLSPVGYSSAVIPETWKLLYYINPMAGIIDSFRWAISRDGNAFYAPGIAISLATMLILFAIGIRCFRRMERAFADVI